MDWTKIHIGFLNLLGKKNQPVRKNSACYCKKDKGETKGAKCFRTQDRLFSSEFSGRWFFFKIKVYVYINRNILFIKFKSNKVIELWNGGRNSGFSFNGGIYSLY